ncbi:hypothetical protein ACJX0J_020164, partial [Zea mays]
SFVTILMLSFVKPGMKKKIKVLEDASAILTKGNYLMLGFGIHYELLCPGIARPILVINVYMFGFELDHIQIILEIKEEPNISKYLINNLALLLVRALGFLMIFGLIEGCINLFHMCNLLLIIRTCFRRTHEYLRSLFE